MILPLVLAASLLGAPARADVLRGPIVFLGFTLGDTLEEVRRKGVPDSEPGDVRLVCSGDRLARETGQEMGPPDDLRKVGVKACHFIRNTGSGQWQPARFKFGRHKHTSLFYFTPKANDPALSERLYLMALIVEPTTFDDLAASLRKQYGKPEDEIVRSIRTKSGTPREVKMIAWYGPRYAIHLQEQGDELDVGGVTYIDHQTNSALRRLAKAAATTPSPRP
ncbi:hypothetical protein [Reyranella sp.]|uniref:hypothetical protein n=1 Tax=Reyranella sp. TaxID=1929291 RepID=UPI001207536C|nr:hypothetical protein [Reyranella sp.]TAJ89231.1 MAG: hypothetical protein EPO50_02340 [Reyranella sp.]